MDSPTASGTSTSAAGPDDTTVASDISHQPRILSLDGGGIRGLSSLLILKELMGDIQRRIRSKELPRPCEYFDLMGGTGTGGLIAIMLGRLKMTVDECIEKYMNMSQEVFNRDRIVFGVLPTGDEGCRFDSSVLESVVKDLIKEKLEDEDAIMAEIRSTSNKSCPAFVVTTSAADAQGPPILFRSYSTEKSNAHQCPIWKAARATSATPSFFDPMFIDIPAPGGWYVDGGLRFNNPVQLAFDEAHAIWPRVKRFCIVSIGTGRLSNAEFVNIENVQSHKETEVGQGFLSWIMSKIAGISLIGTVKDAPGGVNKLADIGKACVAMSTSSSPAHHAMLMLSAHSRSAYYRFNVENGMDTIGLEEWKENGRIQEIMRHYMRETVGQMQRIACVQYLLRPLPVEHIPLDVPVPQSFPETPQPSLPPMIQTDRDPA